MVVLFNVFFGYLYEIKYRDVPVIVYVLIWLVNTSAFCGLTLYKDRLEFSSVGLWKLILLTVCVRLIYLWQRLQLGEMIVDGDIALFYNYAKKFVGGSYPYMEYPQFALLFFSLGYFLSGEQLVSFRIIFPLMQLPFEALIVTCLYKIGAKFGNIQMATILSVFYAVFPFKMLFWFAGYDVIPTAFFLLALYWLITERYVFSAVVMTLGFFTKWVPYPIAPIYFSVLATATQAS
jgi:hypothetical protein